MLQLPVTVNKKTNIRTLISDWYAMCLITFEKTVYSEHEIIFRNFSIQYKVKIHDTLYPIFLPRVQDLEIVQYQTLRIAYLAFFNHPCNVSNV